MQSRIWSTGWPDTGTCLSTSKADHGARRVETETVATDGRLASCGRVPEFWSRQGARLELSRISKEISDRIRELRFTELLALKNFSL